MAMLSVSRGHHRVFLVLLALYCPVSARPIRWVVPSDCKSYPKVFYNPQLPAINASHHALRKTSHGFERALMLRGGSDAVELVDHAYDWATNLGAPAALVAGAVIATLYESMSSGNLDIDNKDKAWVKAAKQATRLFLLSAFILQVICIFCTTILGTHLMSQPPANSNSRTPLEYLRDNFEFEYLTSRISFIQGLVTWLAAIALEHFIPRPEHETEASRNMDVLISSSLATLIIFMMSFYNGHMNFYQNYFEMLCRYSQVIWLRFVWVWPPRTLTLLAAPTLVTSIVYFFKVFFDTEEGKPAKKMK